MIINVDISLKKVQVQKEGKAPEAKEYKGQTCPICGHKMYGHGWRKRYLADKNKESILIWVRRIYCPECKKTGTIIPRFVHALKQYSLRVIKELLAYRIKKGHKDSKSRVSRYLQEIWWKQYCLKKTIGDERKLEEMACPCGLPRIIEVENHERFRMLIIRGGIPHQRLLLTQQKVPS